MDIQALQKPRHHREKEREDRVVKKLNYLNIKMNQVISMLEVQQ